MDIINDILETILHFTVENMYNQNNINEINQINIIIPKIWQNIPPYILQQNMNFINEINKLFKVNKIWKKIVYEKTIKIFKYILEQKKQKKKLRKVNFNIPLTYSNEFIISYTLNHYSLDYLIDIFTNYQTNQNNLILKVPEPADFFNMEPRCERCRVPIYNVKFLRFFQYMNKNYEPLECTICYHKQYWLNKVIKYIKEGYSNVLVNKIKKFINILNKCNKCRNFGICLYHKIDYKYYDIYKILINKYNEIYSTDYKIKSINGCKIV
jgi:hypothetical protein